MGVIRIPCIDVKLPIAHGTDSDTLQKNVGHLSGTSLPVGGPSTHTVLTGHTGLSSARLFSDLVQMKRGDLFFIDVLEETFVYRVTDIYVVEPTDLSKLAIEPGRDLATLVTCTPYGINTQRLLVRGERCEYSESTDRSGYPARTIHSVWQREYLYSLCAGIGFICAMFLTGCMLRRFRMRRKKIL